LRGSGRKRWGRANLESLGFVGWCPFNDLRDYLHTIPTEAGGVYLVYRAEKTPPQFLPKSPGGTWRGDPTVTTSVLVEHWVPGAHVLNIGKADSGQLRKRLRAYHSFGSGGKGRHAGGRYIWQLEGIWQCLVAWRIIRSSEVPRTVEETMIADFVTDYRQRPFANLTD
jgi:hypothetical protein